MQLVVALGGGFLLAVLWFDLMFDVQVLGKDGDVLPEEVLSSIASYYRRVTTDAFPMNRLVAAMMLLTIGALAGLLIKAQVPIAAGLALLILVLTPITLALVRVVPNAIRLGERRDDLATQSRLARRICNDHLFCLACVAAFLALQAWVQSGQ